MWNDMSALQHPINSGSRISISSGVSSRFFCGLISVGRGANAPDNSMNAGQLSALDQRISLSDRKCIEGEWRCIQSSVYDWWDTSRRCARRSQTLISIKKTFKWPWSYHQHIEYLNLRRTLKLFCEISLSLPETTIINSILHVWVVKTEYLWDDFKPLQLRTNIALNFR